ncbi:Signal transduction histidine kinase [Amycolatopsis xylanica]|uniref:histidine kinase n=1 Tax=Amycolatopsis xylanica TaxID=589385 RepID=A0A1H3PDX1_9PSEU|nr:ATP-binding protein [Amycolatopsis xylanica]SDY99257.1 Signal transduction histidine kinase [Amycolatopsis xylanica]
MLRDLWRSTRFRVAAAAALSSMIALGATGVFFVLQAQDRLETNAIQTAKQRVYRIQELLNSGTPVDKINSRISDMIYEIVDREGKRLASCPVPWEGQPLLAGGKYGGVHFVTFELYLIDGNVRDQVMNCLPELYAYVMRDHPDRVDESQPIPLYTATGRSEDQRYMVYAAATPDPAAQWGAETTKTWLLIAVPLVSLLIGVIAWFAVRRSLRPVEALRAEVAEISAHDLGRRVAEPPGRDEIPRLAATMNTMLARLDTAVTRQVQFTADASHELRTPLTTMRNQLEVLLTYPEQIEWRRSCENVLLDVTRMEELVADLLLLSKLEGAETGKFAPVPLAEVVEACLTGREPRDGVTITSEVDSAAVVPGNRVRLTRLLRNLVDNAERHAKSSVRVAVSIVDDECVLTVADDGAGIPEADAERVFDRFVRLDDGRDRDEGGSGLGLAIVAEIAHAHEGTVSIAGSVVTVRLPRAES